MSLIVPAGYRPLWGVQKTLESLRFVNDTFRDLLVRNLDLVAVPAQLCLWPEAGLNDDLGMALPPVIFGVDSIGGRKAEIIRSLSKWKRVKLAEYGIFRGHGLLAESKAIRVDDVPDNIHSIFVDQWDWERSIDEEDRRLAFLVDIVEKIYRSIRELEQSVCRSYRPIEPCLPEKITFVHSEELLQRYPSLPPGERENRIVKEFGAVFVIGIGGVLSDGTRHGNRNPDCDDWSTPCENGFFGLNGDILLWNPVLERSLEISSMGIRVDKHALARQLSDCHCEELLELDFHRAVMEDRLPLSIGGGIGQSRLCMLLLRKAHIGEVQPSLWPQEMRDRCEQAGIPLL